jgi:hypothetical protein
MTDWDKSGQGRIYYEPEEAGTVRETVVLLGAGSSMVRRITVNGKADFTKQWVRTVDYNRSHMPDICHDLNVLPWPIEDNSAHEVHAYELLEHLGRQGDAVSFFGTFYEIWRILVPGGVLAATTPRWDSIWAWGDPSHTRVISHASLVFLDQTQYPKQVGKTPMSDFRGIWRGDFDTPSSDTPTWAKVEGDTFCFVLKAVKPARRES